MVVANLVDPRHKSTTRVLSGGRLCKEPYFLTHTVFPDGVSPAMFLEPPGKAACHHPGALGCKQKCLCYIGPDRCLDEAPAPAASSASAFLPGRPHRSSSGHQECGPHDGHPTPQCSIRPSVLLALVQSHPFLTEPLLAHAPSCFTVEQLNLVAYLA